jgi:hypothetical protein
MRGTACGIASGVIHALPLGRSLITRPPLSSAIANVCSVALYAVMSPC